MTAPRDVEATDDRCPGCGHGNCPRPRGWSSLECDWDPAEARDGEAFAEVLYDLTAYVVPDSPKMLRETLCVAQARIGNSPLDASRKREHIDRLQRLIDECERHRPTGPNGKHDDRHTPTCGCDR